MTAIAEELKAIRKSIELLAANDIRLSEKLDNLLNAIQAPNCVRPDRRGPKNTNMMRCQREAVKVYVEIERHRPISTVTVDDCRHVWNDPDNRAEWNARASRTDSGRGYPNYQALKVGILYWLKQQSRK